MSKITDLFFGGGLAGIRVEGLDTRDLRYLQKHYLFSSTTPAGPMKQYPVVSIDWQLRRRQASVAPADPQGEVRIAVANARYERPDEGLSLIESEYSVKIETTVGQVEIVPGCSTSRVVIWREEVQSGLFPLFLFPLVLAQPLALAGCCLLHCALVNYAGKGFLFLGESMSGKSTVAAACALAGAEVLSDDSGILGWLSGGPVACGFRRRATMRPETYKRLTCGRISSWRQLGSTVDGQVIFDLPWGPGSTGPICVQQVILLGIRHEQRVSTKRPVSDAATLAALIAGTTSYFLSPRFPTERDRMMTLLKGLACAAQSYEVRLGSDLLSEPVATIVRLLAK